MTHERRVAAVLDRLQGIEKWLRPTAAAKDGYGLIQPGDWGAKLLDTALTKSVQVCQRGGYRPRLTRTAQRPADRQELVPSGMRQGVLQNGGRLSRALA
jgi:hypothetical protein